MLKLYENIKLYRKRAKMTQEELARLVGYTDRSSIAKIETGQVDLSQSKIKQFADIFGVKPGDLMGWEWEQEPEDLADVTAQVLQDPALLKMVEQYLRLDEGDQYVARVTVASLYMKKADPLAGDAEKKTDAVDVSQMLEFE